MEQTPSGFLTNLGRGRGGGKGVQTVHILVYSSRVADSDRYGSGFTSLKLQVLNWKNVKKKIKEVSNIIKMLCLQVMIFFSHNTRVAFEQFKIVVKKLNDSKIKEIFYKIFEKNCILHLNDEFKLFGTARPELYVISWKRIRIPGPAKNFVPDCSVHSSI